MANTETNYKIAVLIDYDNFNNEEFLKLLFEELNEYGDIIIKEAYFSNIDSTISSQNNGRTQDKFIEKLQSLGISPRLQLPYTKGKNASDIRIAIEAMDLLNKDYITCFCLASSDSDLTPLAIRLKKENKYVIGAGVEATPKPFKDECNYFINIDTRIKDSKNNVHKTDDVSVIKPETKKGKDKTEKIKDLVTLVNLLIEENKDEKGLVQFSHVIELLRKRQTDFSPKNYGFANNNTLQFFRSILKDYYNFEKKETTDFIGVKK